MEPSVRVSEPIHVLFVEDEFLKRMGFAIFVGAGI